MSRIRLDDKWYALRGPLRWMSISEWGTVLRMTAEQKRSDRAMAADWVIESLTGGLGQKRGIGSGERFWFATAWTLHPGKIMLPPLQQSAAATSYTGTNEDGNLYFMRWMKGALYIGGDVFLKRYVKANDTWTTIFTSYVGGFNPRDACTYWDGSNERIVISFDDTAGNSFIIHSMSGDAGSWTKVAVSTGTGRPYLAVFDGKLLIYTSQGYLAYTTDLTNFTTFQATPLPSSGWYGENSGRGIGIFINSQGKRMPFIATVSKVYEVDIYSQVATEAAGIVDAITPWEYNATVFDAVGSFFYISGQGSLWRLSSTVVTDITPWRDDGLDTSVIPTTARITDILPWGDDILVSIYCSTGYSAILCWTGMGWHTVAVGANNTGIMKMAWEIDSASYAATKRLYYTHGTAVHYMDMPRHTYDLTVISGLKYAASAYLYTSYWGEALSELGAGVFKLYTRGLTFTANETLTVLYSTNYDDATETSLGTISSNSGTLTYASSVGIEAETIRYKLTLARGATNTLTPVLLFLNTKVLKQAEAKFGWEGTIDLGLTASLGRDAETVRAELETLFGIKTNTTLKYAGKTKHVQLLALQGNIEPGDDEGIEGFDVNGAVTVRLAEVV